MDPLDDLGQQVWRLPGEEALLGPVQTLHTPSSIHYYFGNAVLAKFGLVSMEDYYAEKAVTC